MSEELEAVQAVATHPASIGSAVMAVMGWLANKVWRGHRHEIANMKQAAANNLAVLEKKSDQTELDAAWDEIEKRKKIEEKLFDIFREHEQQDVSRFEKQEAASRDRHEELMTVVGDLRVDIASLKK